MPDAPSDPIPVALARASALAEGAPYSAPPSGHAFSSGTVAMGDPQAPLERVLEILHGHGLLGDDGWLVPSVRLVTMGDHVDWGPVAARAAAAYDGIRLLAWLSAHPADQVILLAGNHDLARVGELARLTDEAYLHARTEADRGYHDRSPVRPEEDFRRSYEMPGWELLARDLSAFRSEQRAWVTALLRAGRLRLACAVEGVLLTHAGVTDRELDALALHGPDRANPEAIADALQDRFAQAIRRWRAGVLHVANLHAPADRRDAAGMLHHRIVRAPALEEPRSDGLSRHAPVASLPAGVIQAIGHVRDRSSRKQLGMDPNEATVGRLRTLVVHRERWRYEVGASDGTPEGAAVVIHTDGAMLDAPPEAYELLDLRRRAPRARRGRE
jgi:hypothetical protein